MYNPYNQNSLNQILQPNTHQNGNGFIIVSRNSDEYKSFIAKIEKNYAGNNKLSACTLCWAFISPLKKRKHAEHEPFMVTASLFKNEECFLQLCQQHGKLNSNKQSVILFKDNCQFFGTPQYNPTGGTSVYQGGANPLVNLKEIVKKGNEQDSQLKRLNNLVSQIRDDFKSEDKKLDKLETQFKILKQQVLQYAREKMLLNNDSQILHMQNGSQLGISSQLNVLNNLTN
ncbi:UNKNOWN [Stylonychia lemnae]|uniref:Uncharacterized protein n=1 Tax=Stylonychia lemnae TaxID=5949 RepID=A0A077ZUH5_STYLE|nr:UNKNOWN [Stylonychia lemnae]|eukprot:CDW72945.1 UNKNOWN [Stylonychia lemnae]